MKHLNINRVNCLNKHFENITYNLFKNSDLLIIKHQVELIRLVENQMLHYQSSF